MSGEVHLTITGDEANAFKAFRKLVDQERKMIDTTKELTKESDKLGKSLENSLKHKAARALREIETPLDTYKRKLKELTELWKGGFLDSKQASASHRLIYQQYQALTQVNSEVFQTKKGFIDAFGTRAMSMVGSLSAALGVTGGLAGAVRLVTDYYKELQEVQKASFDQARQLASVEEMTTLNLASVSPSEQDSLLGSLKNMSVELDVPEASLHKRFQAAVSKREAGTTLPQLLDSVRDSYKYARYDDESGSSAAGFGAKMAGRGWSSSQAMGLLEATGAKANISDMRMLTKYVGPSLTRGLQAGLSEQEVGGLFAAVSTGLSDDTGERTRTAISSMFDAVMAYKLKNGESIPGATGEDKMRWLLANQDVGAEFVESAPLGEGRAMFREFFSGGSPYRNFEAYTAEIPGKEAAGQYFEQSSKTRADTRAQRTARVGDFLDVRREQMLNSVPEQVAQLSYYKDQFDEIAKQAGMLGPDRTFYNWKAYLSGNDAADWASNYGVLEQNLASKAYGHGSQQRPDGSWTKGYGSSAPTALERQQARDQLATISPIVDQLEKLHIAMEKTNQLLEQAEKNTKNTAENTSIPLDRSSDKN